MKIKLFLFTALSFCFLSQAQIFTDSNLPIVLITTDTNSETGEPLEIADEFRIGAIMKVIYRPDGTRNFLTDQINPEFLNYNGRISIEIRGSSSQFLGKKPYGLTTLESDNTSNNNVSILDMPQENDWILNALAFDSALIRDFLSYDLSRSMGNYAPRGRFCEVVINGDYKGLYILMEKIKVDSKRVNILKMDTSDNVLPNVTGGYITKCDKTTGGDPVAWDFETGISNFVSFIHDSPNPETVTQEQNDYIFNEFNSLETIMNSQNASIETGFPSVIDVPTFVDFMIMNELASNVDGYQLSTYFHKDRNGKLRAGPIWDFNLAYGLDVFGVRSQTDVWQFDNGDNVGAKFWKNLFDNPVFKCYLNRRWTIITAANQPLNWTTIENKIADYETLLTEASSRENVRWNTVFDFQNSVNEVRNWLEIRINWLDENLTSISNCNFPTTPAIVISKIHYNPVSTLSNTSNTLEFIELTNNSNTTVDVSGYYFKELGISYIFPNNSSISPNDTFYLASNTLAFEQEYGFVPDASFTRNLSNKSQNLSLADPFGNLVDVVEYTDNVPWPIEADGNGPYLTLIDLNSDNAMASNWTTSNQTLTTNDFEIENTTLVYPNPTTSMMTISNSNLKIKAWELFDFVGRKMLSNDGVFSNSASIDTNKLSVQSYLLKITFENGIVIIRKVIRK